jgi:hypothetical protein
MPLHNVLKQLDRLNNSLSGFHDELSNVLSWEEYKQCVPNLQNGDLVWLVEYLDRVRHRIAPPHALCFSQRRLSMVSILAVPLSISVCTNSEAYAALGDTPKIVHAWSSTLDISLRPFAPGGSGDLYEGVLNGSRVCIKRVRVYSDGRFKGGHKSAY